MQLFIHVPAQPQAVQHITQNRCTQNTKSVPWTDWHTFLEKTFSVTSYFIVKLQIKPWKGGQTQRNTYFFLYYPMIETFHCNFFLSHWERKGNRSRLAFPMDFLESSKDVLVKLYPKFAPNRWVGVLDGWEPKISTTLLYSAFFPQKGSHRWVFQSSV